MSFKIGIITNSLKLPLQVAIKKAKEMGVDGVQIHSVSGEASVDVLNAEARKKLKKFIASLDLEISAICGDLGGHGYSCENENHEKKKIFRSKQIVDLAVDLGTKIVTTHIGVVPKDTSDQRYSVMLSACRELGKYASDKGITFAIETGPETATELACFLNDLDQSGIGVNFDPANLVMVTGDDPVRAVETLKRYIVHTHAKDGVKLAPSNAEDVYKSFAEGGINGIDTCNLFKEVALGEGQVNWNGYINALKNIGYTGYLTIERETGSNPIVDIKKAVDFLAKRIK